MSEIYNGPKTSTYKVWHIPQVPMKAFIVELEDLQVAKLLVDVLAEYDLFQFENNIKPDYSNVSGILVWDEDEGMYLDVEEEEEFYG